MFQLSYVTYYIIILQQTISTEELFNITAKCKTASSSNLTFWTYLSLNFKITSHSLLVWMLWITSKDRSIQVPLCLPFSKGRLKPIHSIDRVTNDEDKFLFIFLMYIYLHYCDEYKLLILHKLDDRIKDSPPKLCWGHTTSGRSWLFLLIYIHQLPL